MESDGMDHPAMPMPATVEDLVRINAEHETHLNAQGQKQSSPGNLEHHVQGGLENSQLDGAADFYDDEDDEGSEEWETESMYETALLDATDQHYAFRVPEDDSFSLKEAIELRESLEKLGVSLWVEEYLMSEKYTAKKLCTVFWGKLPDFLEGADDDAYIKLLEFGISKQLSKRKRLPQFETIDHAVELIQKAKKIVVLTGAGISTSLGIPDFRSKGTGLYERLRHLGLEDPQEVFDIERFREDPTIFFSVAKDILPKEHRWTPTHQFIKLLQDRDKLAVNFTQNIDNIEASVGILPDKMVQCHGSFATATCQKCRRQVRGTTIFPDIRAGRVPKCEWCASDAQIQLKKRKRMGNGHAPYKNKARPDLDDSSDETDDILEEGIIKPDITFFGEDLPDTFHTKLREVIDETDLIVVIGTSLKVAPVAEVVDLIPKQVPQIYISRDPCAHFDFDIDLLGECDAICAELCRRLSWDLVHEMIDPTARVKIELEDGYKQRWKITKTFT